MKIKFGDKEKNKMDENIVMPSKEEVKKLLNISANSGAGIETVGDLLGLKLLDSFLPKIENEPEWGYEGLEKFFDEFNIKKTDTILEAVVELK